MKAKKILSVLVSAAIGMSSTHSFAATSVKETLRSFDNKTSEEIQKEIDGLHAQLANLVNSNIRLDNFLNIAGNEGLVTDIQQRSDKVVRGAITAAFAITPIYVAYKTGWTDEIWNEHNSEYKRLLNEAMEKSRVHYQDFLSDLAKTFDTTTPRGMREIKKEFTDHLKNSAEKFSEAAYAGRAITEGLTSNLRYQVNNAGGNAGKIFLDGVNEYMAGHIYNKKYMYEFEQKMSTIERSLNRKRALGVLASIAGIIAGGIYYHFSDKEVELTKQEKLDLEAIRWWASSHQEDRVQKLLDEKLILRAQIGNQILQIQERLILLETILMLRGDVVE